MSTRIRQPAVSAVLLLALFASLGAVSADAADLPVMHGNDLESAYALAASHDLFGRFEARDGGAFSGAFLDFQRDETTGSIFGVRYRDLQILDRIGPVPSEGRSRIIGPVAHFENDTSRITLHNNRHGWISYGAQTKEATVHFPSGSEVEVVPDGLKATLQNVTLRLFYDGAGQNNVSMQGSIAHIRPQTGFLNYTITLQTGIHGFDVRPGSWWLVARAGDTTIADVLRPTNPQHMLHRSDEADLLLHMGPLDERIRLDAAHRIESVGVFPTPPAAYALGPSDRLFQTGNASTLFTGPRAAAWINVTGQQAGVAVVLLRQPFGLSGNVSILQDVVPPRILQVTAQNVTDFWEPETRPPALHVEADEPITATLHLTANSHRLTLNQTRPTDPLRIPLDALHPDTRYDWRLVVKDRAGNQNSTTGTLSTPFDPLLLIPDVSITHPEEDAHFSAGSTVYLNGTVTDGAGRILPPGHVRVTLDDRPVTHGIEWDGARLIVRLGLLEDGPHEARVTATGYSEERVASDTVRFTVGVIGSAPAAALAPLLALLTLGAAALRRR